MQNSEELWERWEMRPRFVSVQKQNLITNLWDRQCRQGFHIFWSVLVAGSDDISKCGVISATGRSRKHKMVFAHGVYLVIGLVQVTFRTLIGLQHHQQSRFIIFNDERIYDTGPRTTKPQIWSYRQHETHPDQLQVKDRHYCQLQNFHNNCRMVDAEWKTKIILIWRASKRGYQIYWWLLVSVRTCWWQQDISIFL